MAQTLSLQGPQQFETDQQIGAGVRQKAING